MKERIYKVILTIAGFVFIFKLWYPHIVQWRRSRSILHSCEQLVLDGRMHPLEFRSLVRAVEQETPSWALNDRWLEIADGNFPAGYEINEDAPPVGIRLIE